MMKFKLRIFLPYLVIIIFSTTCYALFVNEIDYFQVLVMTFLTVKFLSDVIFHLEDSILYLIMILQIISILISGVLNITSFGYGVLFMLTFLYYKEAIYRRNVKVNPLLKLLKYIVYAYAVVQTIQFVSVNVGIPAFNYYGVIEYGYHRYNALSNEPSHTTRICLVIMVVYMYLHQIRDGAPYTIENVFKEDKWLWISYIYVLVMSTSALAFIALPFTFLFFIKPRTLFILAPIFVVICILAVLYIDIPAFNRIKELVPVLFTFDPDVISKVDNSGSARINPFLYYIEDFDVTSVKMWFGYGRGYSEPMLIERVLGHSTELQTGAGGLPVFFYDYGLLAGASVILMIIYFCFRWKFKMLIFVWIIFISSGSFNSYYWWLFICLSYSCIYFDNQKLPLRRKLYLLIKKYNERLSQNNNSNAIL